MPSAPQTNPPLPEESPTPAATPAASSSPPGTIHEMTAFRLYTAWSSANPIFTRLCEGQFNITRREWRLLATVVNHDWLTSSQLAGVAGLDAVRTSRAITGLCAKGWVQRERSERDARTVHVAATPAGRDLYAAMMPAIMELNRLITQDLSDAELDTLHALLERVGARSRQLYGNDLVVARANRGRARGRRAQSE